MKVTIIGPAHPLRGGLASFNERLAREFQHQGHQVSIYTFSLQYPSFLFPGTTQYSSEPKPKDIHINVAINSVNPLNWVKTGLRLKKRKARYYCSKVLVTIYGAMPWLYFTHCKIK